MQKHGIHVRLKTCCQWWFGVEVFHAFIMHFIYFKILVTICFNCLWDNCKPFSSETTTVFCGLKNFTHPSICMSVSRQWLRLKSPKLHPRFPHLHLSPAHRGCLERRKETKVRREEMRKDVLKEMRRPFLGGVAWSDVPLWRHRAAGCAAESGWSDKNK